MKKKILATIGLVMVCGIAFLGVNTHNAQAATVKYEMKKVKSVVKDSSGKVAAVASFKYPQFKGKGKCVKKLNKLIKKDLKAFKKEKKDFLSDCRIWLNEGYQLEDAVCKYTYKVTYNKNNIVSVKRVYEWYAGGDYVDCYVGYNFNTKTGKKLKLSNVINVSQSNLKQAVWNKLITQWGSESDFLKDWFDEISPSDYDFHIKGNKVYVMFDKFEIGYGATGAPVVSFPLDL